MTKHADIVDTWYKNFLLLINKEGGVAEFCRGTEFSEGYMRNMKNKVTGSNGKPRTISMKLARRIEKEKGLPPGWMDKNNSLTIDDTDNSDQIIIDEQIVLQTFDLIDALPNLGAIFHELPNKDKASNFYKAYVLAYDSNNI